VFLSYLGKTGLVQQMFKSVVIVVPNSLKEPGTKSPVKSTWIRKLTV